jgi:hypothetical protein
MRVGIIVGLIVWRWSIEWKECFLQVAEDKKSEGRVAVNLRH